MREYGKIKSAFWIDGDERVASMDDAERLLFAYLMSGPHTTALGCFYAPDGYMANDLRWPVEKLSQTLSLLVAKGFVCRAKSGWVWLRKFLRHNRPENDNVWRHVEKLCAAIPADVPFKAAVTDDARAYRASLKGGLPDPSGTLSDSVGIPEPEPSLNQNPTEVPSEPKRARKVPLPEIIELDDELRGIASTEGIDADREFANCRDWCLDKSERLTAARVRRWFRNPIGKKKGSGNGRPDRPRTGTDALRADPEFQRAAARLVDAASRGDGPADAAAAAGGPHGGDDRRAVESGGEVLRRALPQPAGGGGHLAGRGDPGGGGQRQVPAAGRAGEADGKPDVRGEPGSGLPRADATDQGTVGPRDARDSRAAGRPDQDRHGIPAPGRSGEEAGAADALDAYEREFGIPKLLHRNVA